ncbi:MAG: hypothetical protein LCI00_12490 [Chloroflexi bacterium]|nr:hypothetical protein [Chloroflexota bacterium]MCC6891938.1 hypothetical protein [Anaerolineae bacterium]
MLKKALVLVFIVLVGITYKLFSISIPLRFPQFEEYPIAGPGEYYLPQWSNDSRYLAYIERSKDPTLVVYDSQTKVSWNVIANISSTHFSWNPTGALAYLKYSSSSSGSSLAISELHQVDSKGQNAKILATNLLNAGDFEWFSDGERIAILLTEPNGDAYSTNVYILNTNESTTSSLLNAKSIGLESIASLALAPDEQAITVYGVHEDNGRYEAQIVIYSIETNTVLKRIIPSQVIPNENTEYPLAGLLDSTNFGWIDGQNWLLAAINTPSGKCYNYALFFFDIRDLQKSFCIPSVGGVFDYPTISPDLTKISYVTVAGVGQNYVMVGNVTSDLLNKLKSGGK